MKKNNLIYLLLISVIAWSSCKQGAGYKSSRNAFIEFNSTEHDYGEIPFDGDGVIEFVFLNSGSEPLIVTHVKSTCGCTIPEWSKEPVLSGEKGKIHVEYDTRRVGNFTKSIYVYSNASNGPQKLMITGRILRAEDEIKVENEENPDKG